MTLANYQGVTWRVAARYWAPIPYVELETPSGGRCAVPASRIEILPELPTYSLEDIKRARFTPFQELWTGPSDAYSLASLPALRIGWWNP